MVLLEAFALGIPLVSSRVDGAVEIIKNDLMGALYEDNQTAVNEVLNILNNPDKHSNYLKEFSKQYNDINNYKEKIIEAYKG